MFDSWCCGFIASIQKDPFKKVENLTIRKFNELQEHIKICETCNAIGDEINTKYKDIPRDPNDGWERTNYN